MSGINLKNEPSDQYYSENGGDMHSSSFYNNSNDGFIIKEEYEDVEDPSQILPDCNMYLSEDEHSDNSEASVEQPSTSKRQKMSRDVDGLEYVNSEKPPYQRREKVQRIWSDEETKMLIHIYSEYIPEIGPKKRFKQKKDMWMTISSRMPGKTAKQCEERFKTVLRRKRKWALKNQNANGTTKKQQQKLPLDLPILPHEPQIVWNYTPPVKQYSKTTPNRHKGSSNNTKSSKTNLNTSSQLPEAFAADQGNKSPNKVITRQQQINNHKQHTAAAHNISTNINQSSPKKDRIKQEHMVGIHENHWSTTTNQLNKAKEKPQYEQRRSMEIPKISYTNDVAAIIQDTLLEIAARREEARDRRHREKMEAVTKLQNTLQAILEEGRKKM